MQLSESFSKWIDDNSQNGMISVELLKSKLDKKCFSSELPTASDKKLIFIPPESYKHSWDDIDSQEYFTVLSNHHREYTDKLFETQISDIKNNTYMVEDIFWGSGYKILLVKAL